MTALAGVFLIAHGLVHLAVWMPDPGADAPFDPRHSWVLGDARSSSRALAIAACVAFVISGVCVLAGSSAGAALAVAGAAISIALSVLTLNRWLTFNLAIDVAIAVIALA